MIFIYNDLRTWKERLQMCIRDRGKVNHQDKECVVMAYGLYQESLKENYGMGDLLRLTGRDKSDDMRNEWGKEPEMKDKDVYKRQEYMKYQVGIGDLALGNIRNQLCYIRCV